MPSDFFIRSDGKYIRINESEIRYFESLNNYVKIVTTTGNFLVLISLRQLEQEVSPQLFCRVHRSFIVSLSHIASFDHETVHLMGTKEMIPISPVYKHVLPSKLKVLVCDTRTKTA